MSRIANRTRIPSRWTWLVLVLALCAAGTAHAQAGSGAHSIVGTWTCEVVRPDGSSFRTLDVYHFGGTAANWAAPAEGQIALGSWAKDGPRYLNTFYFLITDANDSDITVGYVKGVQEFMLDGKDRKTGFGDILFLVGDDPLNPDDVIVLSAGETVTCDRLPTEGP